jgi:CMP-N-acetylneuraminic acid synthetase
VKILGLVPARGGSKGVPGKNLAPLAGRSPVQRAYEAGRDSGVCDRIVLSTDDEAIAAEGRRAGLEVPFLRPAALARDDTPMIEVVVHALETLRAEGYEPDAVMLLQPTSPLRTPEHLRRAAELLGDDDSVCSVVPLPREHCPHYVMKVDERGYLDFFLDDGARYTRRQDVPPAYRRDGTVYLTRTPVILAARTLYGRRCVPLVLEPRESLTIDSPEQWQEAERRLAHA